MILGAFAAQGADYDTLPHINGSLRVYHNGFGLSTKFLAYPSVFVSVIILNIHPFPARAQGGFRFFGLSTGPQPDAAIARGEEFSSEGSAAERLPFPPAGG